MVTKEDPYYAPVSIRSSVCLCFVVNKNDQFILLYRAFELLWTGTIRDKEYEGSMLIIMCHR